MKIAVCGVGAMGSVYAGHFREAGHEVWAVDKWRAHTDAIRARGLRLEGPGGARTIAGIRVASDRSEIGPCDIIVIATKAADVGQASIAMTSSLADDTLVLTIQNGLGATERIVRHMPADNVLLGVAEGFGAAIRSPGHVRHEAMNLIRIGEIDGGPSERAEALAALWRDAGFRAQAYEDIQQLVWEKFLCNVTFSAPCAALDMTVGELMAHPDGWRVALGAMREAHALAQILNINLSFDDPEAYVTAFGARMPDARPSMLLDHMARRPSELDAINGQIPLLGRRHGVPTPYNDALVAVLRRREEAFEDLRT